MPLKAGSFEHARDCRYEQAAESPAGSGAAPPGETGDFARSRLLGRNRDRQPLPSLGAPALQNLASGLGAHSLPESVCSLAANAARLIRALHGGCSLFISGPMPGSRGGRRVGPSGNLGAAAGYRRDFRPVNGSLPPSLGPARRGPSTALHDKMRALVMPTYSDGSGVLTSGRSSMPGRALPRVLDGALSTVSTAPMYTHVLSERG